MTVSLGTPSSPEHEATVVLRTPSCPVILRDRRFENSELSEILRDRRFGNSEFSRLPICRTMQPHDLQHHAARGVGLKRPHQGWLGSGLVSTG